MNVFSQSILIEANPNNIRFIDNPNDDIIQMAIEKMPELIKDYKNNDIKFQKIAVSIDGKVIQYLKNPSDEVIEIALKQNGLAIQFLEEKNITNKFIKIALSQNGMALEYLNNFYLTEDLILIALENNGKSIKYIKNQTDVFIKKAINNNGMALEFIKNPSEEVINLAIENEPFSIKFVKTLNEDLIKKAINQNINVINFIGELDINIQNFVVQKLFSNDFQFYTSKVIKNSRLNDFDYYKFEKLLIMLLYKPEMNSKILHKIERKLIELEFHNYLTLIEKIKKHKNYNLNMADIIFDYF